MKKEILGRITCSIFCLIFLVLFSGVVLQHPPALIKDFVLSNGEITKGFITYIRVKSKDGPMVTIQYKDSSEKIHVASYAMQWSDYDDLHKKIEAALPYPIQLHVLKNCPSIFVVDDLKPDNALGGYAAFITVCCLLGFLAGIIGFPFKLLTD